MAGLGDRFSVIYLFGWKQEFNSVRRILGACHLGKSHDASRALSAGPTTPLLPLQNAGQSPKTRPLAFDLELLGFFPFPPRMQMWISWAGWAGSVAPAPLLSCRVSLLRLRSPFSFCSINGCVYNGRRRGRKMRGRRGRVCDVVWGASVQQIKWGKDNASEVFCLFLLYSF